MKDFLRLLATGYLVKRFLAPRVYPIIDQAVDQWQPEMRQIVSQEQKLLVDRGEVLGQPDMLVDGVIYARRRY